MRDAPESSLAIRRRELKCQGKNTECSWVGRVCKSGQGALAPWKESYDKAFVVVRSLNRVRLSATPQTAAG